MQARKDFVNMLKIDASRDEDDLPRLFSESIRSFGRDKIGLEIFRPKGKKDYRVDTVNELHNALYNLKPYPACLASNRPSYTAWVTLVLRDDGLYVCKLDGDETINAKVCERDYCGPLLGKIGELCKAHINMDQLRQDPEYIKAFRYIEKIADKVFTKNVFSLDAHTLTIPSEGDESYKEYHQSWLEMPDGGD